jgi:hypothetical protein
MSRLMSMVAWTGLLLVSCQENDLGSGTNTIVREYAKPAPDAWSAAHKSAEAAGLTVTSDKHDQFGGELVARRANGCEVRIEVKSIDDRTSRVSVRVEPGDRDLAKLIHERIAGKAGLGTATPSRFGGNWLKASYRADLPSCVTSAHHTFSALRVTPTSEETHATSTLLDGRLKDSIPVRIRIEKLDPQNSQVTFIAGDDGSDDNKALAQRMKDEFEKSIPSD